MLLSCSIVVGGRREMLEVMSMMLLLLVVMVLVLMMMMMRMRMIGGCGLDGAGQHALAHGPSTPVLMEEKRRAAVLQRHEHWHNASFYMHL